MVTMVLGLLGGAGLTGCGDRSPPAVWPRPEPPSLARPLDEAPEPSAERPLAETDPAHERARDPAAEADAGVDAGADAEVDAGADAEADAETDAGVDAETDAEPSGPPPAEARVW